VFAGHLPELLLVLVLALVVFGPKRLPEIGGALGKGIKEFRRGTSEIEEKISGSDAHVQERPARITADPVEHEAPASTGAHDPRVS
jgi:TatA/E family protein of Tat protein translocase